MSTMISALEFHKYSALGNHFCLIDETLGPLMDEEDRLFFAQEYTNPEFGVGCDSMLFVQRPDRSFFPHLENRFGEMWKELGIYETVRDLIAENSKGAHAIMRIIEPCGQESAMCGNGIRCMADYLCRKWHMKSIKIIAEVTTAVPNVYEVERLDNQGYRVCMETPRPLPVQFKGRRFNRFALPAHDVGHMLDILLPRRIAEMCGVDKLRVLTTYTGEPHLVCFTGTSQWSRTRLGIDPNQLRDFFSRPDALQIKVLTSLAGYLNERGQNGHPCGIFNPAEGINVSIAQPRNNENSLEMRIYERGIWGMTKACGTGATAVGALAIKLGLIRSQQKATILSEGSYYHNLGSYCMPGYVRHCGELTILREKGSWFLHGPVEHIFSGRIEHWKDALTSRKRHIEVFSYHGSHMPQGNRLHDTTHNRALAV